MSVAAASFRSNSWDLPVRKTGLSFFMSGDVPSHLFQQQQEQEQQEDISRPLHQSMLVSGIPSGDRGDSTSYSPHVSPASFTPVSHMVPTFCPTWRRTQQAAQLSSLKLPRPNQSPDCFSPESSLDRGETQHPLDQQQSDAAIVQKFSALSVCISTTSSCPSDPGAGFGTKGERPLQNVQKQEGVGAGELHSSSPDSPPLPPEFTVPSATKKCVIATGAPHSQGAAGLPVFSSLDAADEQNPPISPPDSAVLSFFGGGRVAPFPPYSPSRASAGAGGFRCCRRPGGCCQCKGVPSLPPLRASASNPIPLRQQSQSGALAGLPNGLNRGHAQRSGESQHGPPASRPNFSWHHLSQSLPTTAKENSAAPQLSPGGTDVSLAQLGWDMLRFQSSADPLSLSPQQMPQHQFLPGHFHQPHYLPPFPSMPAPAPGQGVGSMEGRQGGGQEGAQGESAAVSDTSQVNNLGFGIESMESSSLSLSQDCSDSLGGGEISSAPSAWEEEVDSANSAAEASLEMPSVPSNQHPFPSSPLRDGVPPAPSPIEGPLLPPAHHFSSPLVPRTPSSSVAYRKLPPRDGASSASPVVRRGLSAYFGGKSRSFTLLADVASIESIQELAKPLRTYARRKRINSKNGSSKCGEASRRLALGVGKEFRGAFKKVGGTRPSLGFQAGIAVAAMEHLEVHSKPADRGEEGMETVMEEPCAELSSSCCT